MPKQLIIFIGHPAGGKSSAAKQLAKKLDDAIYIGIDEIKIQISGSVFSRTPDEKELWFKEINHQIKKGLQERKAVVIDEGFFTNELLQKILVGLDNIDFKKLIVEITFELEEHTRRNSERGDTPEPVKHMYDLWNSIPLDQRIKPDIEIHDKKLTTEQIVDVVLNALNKN
jgi:tRNA uridine 5-carbamoylmethylation protein Kti12